MDTIRLADLVRRLRDELYRRTQYRAPHEREWESEEAEREREDSNRESRAEWDAETERLIAAAIKG